MSQTVVYVGTLLVSAVCIWAQLYGARFHDVFRPYDVLEQSVYAAFSHCTWAVILFWLTVCHFTTGFGKSRQPRFCFSFFFNKAVTCWNTTDILILLFTLVAFSEALHKPRHLATSQIGTRPDQRLSLE